MTGGSLGEGNSVVVGGAWGPVLDDTFGTEVIECGRSVEKFLALVRGGVDSREEETRGNLDGNACVVVVNINP